MPTTAELADAVVAALNTAPFSLPFTAERAVLPIATLGEMARLHVTVVAAGRTVAPSSRASLQVDHRIDVAVQQRVAGDDPAACDPLSRLVEEIAEHLTWARLEGPAAQTRWVKTEHAPLIAAEHLHELRQFTSLLAITYRTWESA
jgi:hypothetical protein